MKKYGRSTGTATATADTAGIYLRLKCQLLHLLHSIKWKDVGMQ